MKRLPERNALITGAASGIGRAIAIELAAAGANLWLLDLNQNKLDSVAEETCRYGIRVVACSCDLTKPDQISANVSRLLREWGRLNILVNNAGIGYYGATNIMSAEHWDRLLAVNLHAPIQLIREFLPTLSAQDEAHIVNMSSFLGLTTYRKVAAYQTSKYAMVGLSQALRVEYAGTNLGVSVVCPSFVRDTSFYESMHKPDPRYINFAPPAWLCCTSQQVAVQTVNAIRKNRGLVVVGFIGKILWWTQRLSPGFVDCLYQLLFGFGKQRRARRSKHLGVKSSNDN